MQFFCVRNFNHNFRSHIMDLPTTVLALQDAIQTTLKWVATNDAESTSANGVQDDTTRIIALAKSVDVQVTRLKHAHMRLEEHRLKEVRLYLSN